MAWSWRVQSVFGSIRFPNQPVSFLQPEQWSRHVFRHSSLIDNVVQHLLPKKRTRTMLLRFSQTCEF